MMMSLDDKTKIGIGLTGFGVVFTILGVLFFFDRGLLAMGNLLFLAGVSITIGFQAALKFFKNNPKGSGCFLGGVGLVVFGWTWLGFLVETYGFWILFKGFIPNVLQFFRRIPVFGKVLDLPILKKVLNRLAPKQTLPV